jgi:hypothetical protein
LTVSATKSRHASFLIIRILQRIVLRTLANGQKKAFVYGQNGDVNILPDAMHDRAMICQADELAKSVGINSGRNENNLPYFQQKREQIETEGFALNEPQTQTNPSESVYTKLKTDEIAATEQQISQNIQPGQSSQKDYQAEVNEILLQTGKSRRAGKVTAENQKIEKSVANKTVIDANKVVGQN